MNKKKAKKHHTNMQRVRDKDFKFELPEDWDVAPNKKEKEDCDSCSG